MLKALLNREDLDLHISVSVSPLITSGIYQITDGILQIFMWYIPGIFNRN
jgi:hypothetical protein